jgi:hypothetical protein
MAPAPAPVNFATFATFAKFIRFIRFIKFIGFAATDWMALRGGAHAMRRLRLVRRYALLTSGVLFILGVCG